MRDFITFSQILNSVVGKLSDVASAAGSVLARLKYIIDTSIPGVNTNISTLSSKLIQTTLANIKTGVAVTTSVTYVTAHTYTGSGILRSVGQGLTVSGTTAAEFNGLVKITLDGTLVYDGAASVAFGGASSPYYSTGTSMPIFVVPTVFTTSLLIQHRTDSTASKALTIWNYTI